VSAIVPVSLSERGVFSVSGIVFTWRDVVLAAEIYGAWADLERSSREGLACESRLLASGVQLPPQEIVEAALRFRYARGLLAGEELQHWLERWEVSQSDWGRHLRRALLREHWSQELSETLRDYLPSDEALERVRWTDVVCSGIIERVAVQLAGDAALVVDAGLTLDADREAMLAQICTEGERFRRETQTEKALEREISGHRLDWLRLEGETLTMQTIDAAREGALCVREEGQSLQEVALACGIEPVPLDVYAADLSRELAALLLAADEGDLVGPIELDEGFMLVRVDVKRMPSTSDEAVKRRAADHVTARAVDRATRDHVEWHERFGT
jgi:hypothetical protein